VGIEDDKVVAGDPIGVNASRMTKQGKDDGEFGVIKR